MLKKQKKKKKMGDGSGYVKHKHLNPGLMHTNNE